MRSRQAWLRIFAAVLGVSPIACQRAEVPATEPAQDASPIEDTSIVDTSIVGADASDSAALADATLLEDVSVAHHKAPAPADSREITQQVLNQLTNNPICGARANCGGTGNPPVPGLTGNTTPPLPPVTVDVSGSNTIAGDAPKVAQLRPRVKMCVNAGLAQDPTVVPGVVTVAVSIAPSGEVTAAALGSSTLSPNVANCMVQRVRGQGFAPGSARRSMTITIKESKP